MIIILLYVWSTIDLMLTITFYNHNGFYEINPIARYIMSNGINCLCWFKLFFTLLICGIYYYFFYIRKQFETTLRLSFYFIFIVWTYYWTTFLLNRLGDLI